MYKTNWQLTSTITITCILPRVSSLFPNKQTMMSPASSVSTVRGKVKCYVLDISRKLYLLGWKVLFSQELTLQTLDCPGYFAAGTTFFLLIIKNDLTKN